MTLAKVDLASFKEWLIPRVDPTQVWADTFPGWREGKPVKCPFHDDNKASLSLSANGQGLCHACGWKCSWVGGFVEQHSSLHLEQVLHRLRLTYVKDMLPQREYLPSHKYLYSSQACREIRDRLLKERGIDLTVIGRRRLGWKNGRLIIPIFDEFGCCVNIRRHDALRMAGAGAQKTLSYAAGFGEGRLYPLDTVWGSPKVYLFEGEPDALCAMAQGLPAVSTTGGAGAWKEEWSKRLAGKKVVICYDNDLPGIKGARAVAKALEGKAKWVKILDLPFDGEGKDLTDWIVKDGHTVQEFLKVEKEAPYVSGDPGTGNRAGGGVADGVVGGVDVEAAYRGAPTVPLGQTARPELVDRPVRTEALVSAVDVDQYGVPKEVTATCMEYAQYEAAGKIPKKCQGCIMPELKLRLKLKLEADRRENLSMIGKSDREIHNQLAALAGVPKDCDVEMKVESRHIITRAEITPDVSSRESGKHAHVVREAYVFEPIESNRRYVLTGKPILHPETQQSVQVAVKAEPLKADIDGYELSKEQVEELDSAIPKGDPYDVLMHLYDDLSRNITFIVGRPLLHAAADLVFFSPLTFDFNGSRIHHGWLEAMIVGDTRCGKGFVVENLMKYYQAGELVNGENVSVAGLIGGLEAFGKRWQLRWGVVALHDRGLVAIDEAGDTAAEVIARMSRIRSEGVAEVSKVGHHHRTQARTRLLWLCNPRLGVMADYIYGVLAVQSVMEKAEDVARLDYAFCVAASDVAPEQINRAARRPAPPIVPQALAAAHLRWVWSRGPGRVRFEPAAERAVLEGHAPDFARKYHPSVPLVQGQDVRVKLARVAAAVAARVFSHDPEDPSVLVVEERHVDAAARILDEFYKHPAVAYDAYSRKQYGEAAVLGTDELDQMLVDLKGAASAVVTCLLTRRLTEKTLAATARMDAQECASAVIAPLLRANAIKEKANCFVITPQGKAWLERKEREAEEAACTARGR